MSTSTDFELIRESVDQLCKAEIGKYTTEQFYNTVPRPLFDAFGEAGLTGFPLPEQYGGLASSAASTAAVLETIARYNMGPAIFLSVHFMVSGLLSQFGSEKQKATYLPALASGKMLGAFALTEPQAGSDAAALKLEARKTTGGYTLNGNKCYITSAGFADLYLAFAKTPGEKGSEITAFIVPSETKGLTFGKPERKMGCELSPIASLFFEEAFVPDDSIVGGLDAGYRVALSGLSGGRINIAAIANGVAATAVQKALSYMNERQQFGKPIMEFQGLQFILADMYTKLEAARLLTTKAAEDLDASRADAKAGVNVRLSSSVAKCFATDAAMEITTDAVQLLGGAGYVKEYDVEGLMRDAKMLQIVEGTNQIQRMIIARELKENGV